MENNRGRTLGAILVVVGVGLIALFISNPPSWTTYGGGVEAERMRYAVGIAIGAMLIAAGWFIRQR